MSAIERRVLELMGDGEHDTYSEEELQRLAEQDVAAEALLKPESTADANRQAGNAFIGLLKEKAVDRAASSGRHK
jgi:hypothetical protein